MRSGGDLIRTRVAFLALTLAASALPGRGARGDPDLPPSPYPLLLRTYYDYGVTEYCGQVDLPVHNGFALLRLDELARGNVSPAVDVAVRIEAGKTVDYEYQDRGLSGQKNWCRTEGAAAVERFTHYFRTRQLPPASQ